MIRLQGCAKANANGSFPDILRSEPHRYKITVGRVVLWLFYLD